MNWIAKNMDWISKARIYTVKLNISSPSRKNSYQEKYRFKKHGMDL